MKMFKKSLSVILALVMIFGCMSVVSFAADGKATVSLRIEGIKDCFYYGDVAVSGSTTVLDVIKQADKDDNTLSVTVIPSIYGDYVKSINGLEAGKYTALGWDGWSYRVDGVEPDVGVGKYTVSGGETIVMYYADPWNTGMQYPIINTKNLANGEVSFTSIDSVFDSNTFEMVEKERAVTGYTLTWGTGSKKVVLTPDENGVCKIPYKYLTLGKHSVQIEKYDEKTGLPTVLRYAPDFSVEIGLFDAIMAFFKMIVETISSIIG